MNSKMIFNQSNDYTSRYTTQSPYALYVHIPFCVQKCNYCDFASWSFDYDSDIRKSYVAAVIARMEEIKNLGLMDNLTTCYIGGGTPTVLEDELINLCHYISRLANFAEWTVEANPESLTSHLLGDLYTYGVNRLSIGTQSFNDNELKTLGRIHSARRAREAIAQALALPYQVSLDLMCAFPGQTEKSWRKTLQDAIDLNPHHISCYPLQIEDDTIFGSMLNRGEIEDVADTIEANRMKLAAQVFQEAGYSRYEVASYARSDDALHSLASKHNQAYWTGHSYLGVGISASSMLTREQYERLRSSVSKLPELFDDTTRIRLKITSTTDEFINAHSLCDLSYEIEFLNYPQALAEDMMLGCRMSQGIHPILLQEAKNVLGEASVVMTVQKALDKGLASFDEHGFFKPTETGWLMGNELYGIFWEQVNQDTHWFAV